MAAPATEAAITAIRALIIDGNVAARLAITGRA